jgi:hypothetical protein
MIKFFRHIRKDLMEKNKTGKYLKYAIDETDTFAPSLKSVIENSDSLLRLTARGLKEEDIDFILNNSVYAGGSQLNLYDATYEELLNTGKLYTLGSDSMILAIKNYYKRYEREIEYNRRWTTYTLDGLNMTETSFGRLTLDYELNPEGFNLTNYPWYFLPNSEKYVKMQTGLRRLLTGQGHDLGKCIALNIETDKLITILEKELKESYR